MVASTSGTEMQSLVLAGDCTVLVGGEPITLSPCEYRALAAVVAQPRALVPYREIGAAYSQGGEPTSAAIRVVIHRLRRKLGVVGLWLKTERRAGLVYDPPAGLQTVTAAPGAQPVAAAR